MHVQSPPSWCVQLEHWPHWHKLNNNQLWQHNDNTYYWWTQETTTVCFFNSLLIILLTKITILLLFLGSYLHHWPHNGNLNWLPMMWQQHTLTKRGNSNERRPRWGNHLHRLGLVVCFFNSLLIKLLTIFLSFLGSSSPTSYLHHWPYNNNQSQCAASPLFHSKHEQGTIYSFTLDCTNDSTILQVSS